jgi:LysR family glycine cleavage system transcriptional activator
MPQNLNLNALRVFAIAARCGNFQRAAEKLHISHGAVSQRIKQLESDLGVVLFERQPRGVKLTPNGESYCKAVEEALAILTTAKADLERVSNRITFHLGSSFATKWLMPRMHELTGQLPDVSIATEIHDSLLERNLGRNEIAFWPAKDSGKNSDHYVRCLAELKLVAVCSPNLLRPDWPVDTQTLLSFPLLQDSHRRWERLISEIGYDGDYSLLNIDRSALALDAAIKGHGVAIAPTFMIKKDILAGHLVEIWQSQEASGEYLFMSWARPHGRDKHLKQTVNWVLSEFGLEGV